MPGLALAFQEHDAEPRRQRELQRRSAGGGTQVARWVKAQVAWVEVHRSQEILKSWRRLAHSSSVHRSTEQHRLVQAYKLVREVGLDTGRSDPAPSLGEGDSMPGLDHWA